MAKEELLSGGNVTPVVRVDDTIRRVVGPWSAAVHSLLLHLKARGFSGAPRFLGIDEQGREILTFIEGEVGRYPYPSYILSDGVLLEAACLVRRYHDATTDYTPPAHAAWQFTYPDATRHEVICHNDLAPYNMVFVDEQPQALIDFDTAGPGPRAWDLAYAAYRFVPLSYAQDVEQLGLANPAEQARRLHEFCHAYNEAGDAGNTGNAGDVQLDEILALVEPRVQALCDLLITRSSAGEAAYQQMVADGHLAHYQREVAAFRRHRSEIEGYLAH